MGRKLGLVRYKPVEYSYMHRVGCVGLCEGSSGAFAVSIMHKSPVSLAGPPGQLWSTGLVHGCCNFANSHTENFHNCLVT